MELSLTEATAAMYRSRAANAQRRIDQDVAIGRGPCKHDAEVVARNLRLAEVTESGGQSWPPAVRTVPAPAAPRGWSVV